jgi:hypothetical protein
MALFKRKRADATPEKTDYEFQPVTIRQVILANSYNYGVFVHLEKDGSNYLKATLDGEEWTTKKVLNRSEGDALMASIRADWKNAIPLGLIPENTKIYANYMTVYGFAAIDFQVKLAKFEPDQVFTLGRELVEKIRDGWYPQTDSEHYLLFNFLAKTPLSVGFFGPFKYILKTLTDRFPEICASKPEFASRLSASLGFGYGRIDAFASHLNRIPETTWVGQVNVIHTLPELVGFQYPHLKTLQFLMRKSLRFLSYLERDHESIVITRFKAHALWATDIWHQKTDTPEERYLSLQQLTCKIIYGDTKLAVRDRDSRKLQLAPREERHLHRIDKNLVGTLTEEEIAVYQRCFSDIKANHLAIAHYVLDFSFVFPGIEIKWSEQWIKALFYSESALVRKAVWDEIQRKPEFLLVLTAKDIADAIDSADPTLLAFLLAEVSKPTYFFRQAINAWMKNHVKSELSPRDLEIAIHFLRINWTGISNNSYTEPPLRDTVFLQVVKQTQLQPFSAYSEFVRLYYYYNEDLAIFYGVKSSQKFEQGLLDLLDIRNPEMLDFFARPLAALIDKASSPVAVEIFAQFLNSPKRGASELAWHVLGRQLINGEKISAILEYLDQADPSGTPYLRALTSAVEIGQASPILNILNALSTESKETFWRRNGSEVETILMSWKGFPSFYWKNLEGIPAGVATRLNKFVGLPALVLNQISPSSIAKMTTAQISFFLSMVKTNTEICANPSMLRAMIIAPDAQINEIAAKYVKDENKFAANWLLMLESNLPVSQQAALGYLRAQIESSDFASTLLMALDSNNSPARKLALSVLSTVKSPAVIRSVVDGLVENRNTDTWKIVSKNLELVSSTERYKEFTSQVFLSRRKGRQVKEEIKFDIEELIEDISEAIEKDTLIRMAHSSIASDRNWALKQIALSEVALDDVTVERAWSEGKNV